MTKLDLILVGYGNVARRVIGRAAYRVTTLNGLPGFIFHTDEGTETLAFEVTDGQIVASFEISNRAFEISITPSTPNT